MTPNPKFKFAIGNADDHAYIELRDSYEARNLVRVLAEGGVTFEFSVYTPTPQDWTKPDDQTLAKSLAEFNEKIQDLELEKGKIETEIAKRKQKGKSK